MIQLVGLVCWNVYIKSGLLVRPLIFPSFSLWTFVPWWFKSS